MNEGIVYVLTNPAMPGIVKIGRTGRAVEARLADLYSTGVPLPFECEYAAKVKDQNEVVSAFHLAFGPYRINPKREFFNIEPANFDNDLAYTTSSNMCVYWLLRRLRDNNYFLSLIKEGSSNFSL